MGGSSSKEQQAGTKNGAVRPQSAEMAEAPAPAEPSLAVMVSVAPAPAKVLPPQPPLKEIEGVLGSQAWGAAMPNDAPRGMVGRLASAAVMNIEFGEMGSADSMIGKSPNFQKGAHPAGNDQRTRSAPRMSMLGSEDPDKQLSKLANGGVDSTRTSITRRPPPPDDSADENAHRKGLPPAHPGYPGGSHPGSAVNGVSRSLRGSSETSPRLPSQILMEAAGGSGMVADPDAPVDPWASLQAAYSIRGSNNNKTSTSGRQSGSGYGASNRKSNGQMESMVLSDDEDGGGKRYASATNSNNKQYTANAPRLPPVKPQPAGTVKGRWGDGDLAVAGTLMMGEHDAMDAYGAKGVRNGSVSYGQAQVHRRHSVSKPEDDDDEDLAALGPHHGHSNGPAQHRPRSQIGKAAGRAANQPVVPDIALEEVDDFDALAHDDTIDASALRRSSLLAKMAAFDAQYAD